MSAVFIKTTLPIVFFLMIFIPWQNAQATTAVGAIDTISRYAWSENAGWIDFGTGSVNVTATELTGYAWSENVGWISMNCSNTASCGTVDFKVVNDGAGNLSGYAWGENTGWIDFNCAATASCETVDFSVKTDWRPAAPSPSQGTNQNRLGLLGLSNSALSVNNGATATASQQVTLNLTGGPNTATVLVSEDRAFSDIKVLTYEQINGRFDSPFRLSDGPGTKTIYAKFCTAWGLCSDIFSTAIALRAVPAVAPYDIDGDGRVDMNEFNRLMADWGPQPGGSPVDYNNDGSVDLLDFNLLMFHWTL